MALGGTAFKLSAVKDGRRNRGPVRYVSDITQRKALERSWPCREQRLRAFFECRHR